MVINNNNNFTNNLNHHNPINHKHHTNITMTMGIPKVNMEDQE